MTRTMQPPVGRLRATQRTPRKNRALTTIGDALSLREVRKNLNLTQTDVARRLKKGQDVVSRIEQRGDLLLSTLNDYVHALGGELELVCRLKDRPTVRIAVAMKVGAIEADTGKSSMPGVPPSIAKLREPIKLLCEQHGVRELSLFGSILRSDFDHVSSDVDAAVLFGPPRGESMARQYLDFKQDLERLFGRQVDLIELDAMPDTRLKSIIECTKMRVYAATG